MNSKVGPALFCLVFVVAFGGVGVFGSWMIGSMVRESFRAADWVVVQATVESANLHSRSGRSTTHQADGTYRYRFGGKEYVGTRLGVSPIGGADNIGDWQESMADYLRDAMRERRTISVFVNPDNPAEAVVDRDVRWGFVVFMGLFAVIFGGVGVGALAALVAVLRAKPEPVVKEARAVRRAAVKPANQPDFDAGPPTGDPEIERIFGKPPATRERKKGPS
jgi:hypothetical protein